MALTWPPSYAGYEPVQYVRQGLSAAYRSCGALPRLRGKDKAPAEVRRGPFGVWLTIPCTCLAVVALAAPPCTKNPSSSSGYLGQGSGQTCGVVLPSRPECRC